MKQEKRPKIIAVDFDGCLSAGMWPEPGIPCWDNINRLLAEWEAGAYIILWTCRAGDALEAAVKACQEWGITFDAVNENLPFMIEAYGGDTRKIVADEYWDDKAVPVTASSSAEKHLDFGEADANAADWE